MVIKQISLNISFQKYFKGLAMVTFLISVLERLEQRDSERWASLSYILRPCLNTKQMEILQRIPWSLPAQNGVEKLGKDEK